MRDDFAVFIISHGRPNKQLTLNYLLTSGYTGKYWIVVDDQDSCLDEYKDLYAGNLLIFTKSEWEAVCDIGSSRTKQCATFARNFVEHFATLSLYNYFAVMDDDITQLRYRYIVGDSLKSTKITGNIDRIFDCYLEFLAHTNISTISVGVAKTFIGGISALTDDRVSNLRECYTMYIRNANVTVDWISAVYEDIVTASLQNKVGKVWLQLPFIQLDTLPMMTSAGGNSKMYAAFSQFEYPFHAVMYSPSSISIRYMRNKYIGVINKNTNCPKIISIKHKRK